MASQGRGYIPVTRKTLNAFAKAGVHFYKNAGIYVVVGNRFLDSRSTEWRPFLETLVDSPLGDGAVELGLSINWNRYPKETNIPGGAVVREIYRYIDRLGLKRFRYTKLKICWILGKYKKAKTVLPIVIDILRNPPHDGCPLTASLGKGSCAILLHIVFDNLSFEVEMFQDS